jgi:Ca2+-binding RTX toxin-like protein
MTDYVITADDVGPGTRIIMLSTDLNLYVKAGVLVAGTGVAGTGVEIGGANFDCNVQIHGDVFGTAYGLYVNNYGLNLFVGAEGSLTSSDTALSLGFNGGNQVVNDGEIHGDLWGIVGTGGGLDAGEVGNEYANNGTISSGDRALVDSGEARVINNGTISAGEFGIWFVGGDNDIVNTGTVTGNIAIHIGADEFGDALGGSRIDNAGTIGGTVYAIEMTGDGDDAVGNTGTIQGAVLLGPGNDVLDNTNGLIYGAIDGGDGDDTLMGGAGNEGFILFSGNDTVQAGGGDDFVLALGAGDVLDGGSGYDVLRLVGDYPVLDALNFEKIQLTPGADFTLTPGDDTVAAGATLKVDGSELSSADVLDFNASGERDGSYHLIGGGAGDVLVGGEGDDRLVGSAGKDKLTGGRGADRIEGGSGKDTIVYKVLGDSTGADYDTVIGFDTADDTFKLPVAVIGVDAAASGALSRKSFDSDLADAATGLGAGHAMAFTANSGTLDGRVFLIVDANGDAGYQANEDYVIAMADAVNLAGLGTANFT